MSKGKVTRWRVPDGEGQSRRNAWEVCIPVGNGQIDTIIFSGPNSAGRSARYAEEHGWKAGIDFAEIEAKIDDETSIEDLLA